MKITSEQVTRLGDILVEIFHYIALFVIGATIVWSAVFEYIHMMENGRASLKDILLLFIYLELGAMVGIYFKTRRLPVEFLIYIAITALARHLVVDVEYHDAKAMFYQLAGISGAILILTVAIIGLAYARKKYALDD